MSYRKIISVVNEQTASTVMARYAISLAAGCKAALVLYSAHDEGSDEALLRHTDRHMDHLFTVAFELGISVSRINEVGNISRLLPKRVQAEQADLVFYPLTPDAHPGASLQRQTVEHLQRNISPDIVFMRAISMAKPHPRHILVPFGKFISDRERRLIFISELARSFHAQVTLFHLAEENAAKAMPDDISRFRQQLQQQDVKVLERTGRGHIGKAITVEAITRHNDLIVLGTSERGLLRRLFFGNPAADVMHQPPCNAILFRAAAAP